MTLRASAAVLLLVTGIGTQAAVVGTYTSRVAFDAAVVATTTESFNSFATEVAFHTVPLDVGPFALSMTGTPNVMPRRNTINLPPTQFPEFSVDGTNVVNVLLDSSGDSLFLSFDSPINAFGADFGAFNDSALLTRIIAGTDVLEPPIGGMTEVRFFGFRTNSLFSTLEFRYVDNDGFSFDNVAFGIAAPSGTTPEPGTLALLGLGLAGLAATRRRKK